MMVTDNEKKTTDITDKLIEITQRIDLNIKTLLKVWLSLQKKEVKNEVLNKVISELVREQYTCLEGLSITIEKMKKKR
ncbi:hypothetical protein ACTVOR_14795 [Serratia nevei]|uniref:hypothetical protein n=1 Tax=Serratia nevei TaxID=2703794 RepID=UPI003FA76FEB